MNVLRLLCITIICNLIDRANGGFIRSYTKLEGNGTGLAPEAEDKGGYRPEDVIEWVFWILFGVCAILLTARLWKIFR